MDMRATTRNQSQLLLLLTSLQGLCTGGLWLSQVSGLRAGNHPLAMDSCPHTTQPFRTPSALSTGRGRVQFIISFLTNKQNKQTSTEEKKKKPLSFAGWDLPPKLGSYIWTMRRGIVPQNRIIASCSPVTLERIRVNSSSLPFPITGSSRSFPNSSWVQENAVPSPGDGEQICLWTPTWNSLSTQHFGALESALHVSVDTQDHCYSCSTSPSKWHYVSQSVSAE